MSGIIEKIRELKESSDEDKKGSTDEEDEIDNDDTIIQRVTDFIKTEVPTSNLMREFNGNFVYQVGLQYSHLIQIPLEGFKAEKFY